MHLGFFACPPDEARINLIVFPPAASDGVGASRWQPVLGDVASLHPVRLPGRGARIAEPPYRSMRALVRDLVEGMAPFLDTRYAFLGASMGGWVAFEVLLGLRRAGVGHPAVLIMCGTPSPDDKAHLCASEDDVEPVAERLIADRLRLSRTPWDADTIEYVRQCLTCDLRLCVEWTPCPEPPVAVPVHCFAGASDWVAPRSSMDRWRRVATGPFSITEVPGGHSFLDDAPPQVVARIWEICHAALEPSTAIRAGSGEPPPRSMNSTTAGVSTMTIAATGELDPMDRLRDFVLSKHQDVKDLPSDLDIIESKLIDSLQFIEFVYLVQELSGTEVQLDHLDLEDFRTLRAIQSRFFTG